MSSKNIQGTAVAAGVALVVAVTLTAGPAQAKRPDLDGRVGHATHASHAGWDGEQNMAVRHTEETVAWRLGLGG